jgi:PIN domain nuclease of toxin-antitoxin system
MVFLMSAPNQRQHGDRRSAATNRHVSRALICSVAKSVIIVSMKSAWEMSVNDG